MKKKEYIKPETKTAEVFIQLLTASDGDPLPPIPENAPEFYSTDGSGSSDQIEDMEFIRLF